MWHTEHVIIARLVSNLKIERPFRFELQRNSLIERIRTVQFQRHYYSTSLKRRATANKSYVHRFGEIVLNVCNYRRWNNDMELEKNGALGHFVIASQWQLQLRLRDIEWHSKGIFEIKTIWNGFYCTLISVDFRVCFHSRETRKEETNYVQKKMHCYSARIDCVHDYFWWTIRQYCR